MSTVAERPTDGRRFPCLDGEFLSWDIGAYMTQAEAGRGYPKARTVIQAMKVERPDMLEREHFEMLKALFNPMFGRNAKRVLDLIEEEMKIA